MSRSTNENVTVVKYVQYLRNCCDCVLLFICISFKNDAQRAVNHKNVTFLRFFHQMCDCVEILMRAARSRSLGVAARLNTTSINSRIYCCLSSASQNKKSRQCSRPPPPPPAAERHHVTAFSCWRPG